MILKCPYCRQDSAGNHEPSCCLNPNQAVIYNTGSGPQLPTDTERLEWLMRHMAECGMAPQSREYIDWAMRGFTANKD